MNAGFSPFPRHLAASVATLALLMLAGCGALTNTAYTRPDVRIPDGWQRPGDAAGTTNAVLPTDGDAWWRGFGDDDLNRFVERALAGNQSLAAAAINARRALLSVDASYARSLPQLSVGGSTSHSRTLRGAAVSTHGKSISAAVSYQVDLWGSLASATDAARWEAQASDADRRNVALQVAAATVTVYWQLALLSEQLDQNALSIADARKTAEIANQSYRAGAIAAIDRLAARQSLLALQSDRASLLDSRTQTSNALWVLLGSPPGEDVAVSAQRLDRPLPPVAVGVPAELLARRPDVGAAELRVRESLSALDATRTSFYPNLTLTGSAGSSSDALRDLLQNPVGSLAAALAVPLVNLWTMRASVDIARMSYEASAVSFRATVYQAMSDVENALSERDRYGKQNGILTDLLRDATESEARYEARYRAGAIPLQSLIDAQQARRSAQTQLALNRYGSLVSQVALYEALGGGDSGAGVD